MTERVNYKRIFISYLRYEGGRHLEEFLRRVYHPLEMKMPEIPGWEKSLTSWGKMTIPTQYIVIIEDKHRDEYVGVWEIHYDKTNCKEIEIRYQDSVLDMEDIPEIDLVENIFDDLFSGMENYEPVNELYLRTEIYSPGIFDIVEGVYFWQPDTIRQCYKRELCEEIKFLPRPRKDEPFGEVFPGGIHFQEAEKHFESMKHYYFSNLKSSLTNTPILPPHTLHVPCTRFFLFFIVSNLGLTISRLALHLTQ